MFTIKTIETKEEYIKHFEKNVPTSMHNTYLKKIYSFKKVSITLHFY